MDFFVEFRPFFFFFFLFFWRWRWLLVLCVEVEIKDVAVFDLFLELRSDVRF